MQGLGTVQQKIPCLFVTTVKEEPSTKRDNQSFRVLATGDVNPKALEADIHNAIPTEKVDGTCCYITKYKGVPYLWARLDRKPTKQAEKRYRKFQLNKTSSIEFTWNINDDFRTVPESWIPARGVLQLEGQPQPDENGHIPGWIPVEQESRQYCWHGSAVNYETEVAMVMKAHSEQNRLEITTVHLMQLLEQTLELVGTHINGNPYGLGSKKRPVHALVSHGALQIQNPPALSYSDLITWFEESQEGKIEGIVWHCTNGVLIKLHRQHVGLQWPVTNPYLTARPVSINVDLSKYNCNFEPKSSFMVLAKLNGERFDHLRDIHWDNVGNNCTEGV